VIKKYIQFGQFQICLVAFTPLAQSCLVDFLANLPRRLFVAKEPSSDLIWYLYILDTEPIESGLLNSSSNGKDIWRKIHRAGQSLGSRGMGSFFSVQSELGQYETEFIHFMSPDRSAELERLILIIHLTKIIQRYLMVNGNISLHASTIVHNGFCFLFLGKSGAGKSTVTMLSKEKSKILNDEKIFLTPHQGRYILSRIPVLNENRDVAEENLMIREQTGSDLGLYSLSGIFILNQDSKDFLLPVPSLTTAHALMNSFIELPRLFTPSRDEMLYVFGVLSRVAREISAFELHFRKSPDFWKLIDEQFLN